MKPTTKGVDLKSAFSILAKGAILVALVAVMAASVKLNIGGARAGHAAAEADLWTALIVASEIFAGLGAVFLFAAGGENKGRAAVLALITIGCTVFNWQQGRTAIEISEAATAPVVVTAAQAAAIDEALETASHQIGVLATPNLSSPDAVKTVQTVLAELGLYAGAIDGAPGGATGAALAAKGPALEDLRERRTTLQGEADAADAAAAQAEGRKASSMFVSALIEFLKITAAWAFGFHVGDRAKTKSHEEIAAEIFAEKSAELDRIKPVAQKSYVHWKTGKPTQATRRAARGARKAHATA